MSRNMRSLLRACVLFLNLRKEKGTATETDLGARSLGICSKEQEEVEVSAARSLGRSVGSASAAATMGDAKKH